MWHRVTPLSGPIVLFSVWIVSGCADGRPATFPAAGRVVFADGTPVTSGTVELESVEDGINARGAIQPDGTFRLSTYETGDGALPGRHRVAVIQMVFAQDERAIHHDHAADAQRTQTVHPKYATYDTSGLAVDVLADRENEIPIVVESAR